MQGILWHSDTSVTFHGLNFFTSRTYKRPLRQVEPDMSYFQKQQQHGLYAILQCESVNFGSIANSTDLRNAHESAAAIVSDVKVEHFVFDSQRLRLR